ncbi:ribonuclease [Wenjunlia vitaminophila]|uniref:Ribonuclease n=1 Tax=Wenjunlia vitaminophila TaxID=76728 RepID=A0A0T6LR37_WENVI|nr:endonuclease [Wenjunlia vitaminophila]KRV48586.1 ribonuclease [Wenjunlia vitaminophila]
MSAQPSRRSWRRPLVVAAVAAALAVPSAAVATDTSSTVTDWSDRTAVQVLDDTYYQDAVGKTGPELKAALHTIIRKQSTLSYSQVWDALRSTDEDPNNPANVILLYTGRSQSKTANGGDADDWNREHVWAKSHGDFGTVTGPGTDIHHLRPTDVSVNSTRGNKDFDNGGQQLSEAPGNYTDSDSFEPRDAVKGDVARMILYMAVRYDGDDGFADLEPNDQVNNGSAPAIGRLSVLKQWSLQDPPDAFEEHRNQVIYDQYQHNRNPFIDHPEWVDAIW